MGGTKIAVTPDVQKANSKEILHIRNSIIQNQQIMKCGGFLTQGLMKLCQMEKLQNISGYYLVQTRNRYLALHVYYWENYIISSHEQVIKERKYKGVQSRIIEINEYGNYIQGFSKNSSQQPQQLECRKVLQKTYMCQ